MKIPKTRKRTGRLSQLTLLHLAGFSSRLHIQTIPTLQQGLQRRRFWRGLVMEEPKNAVGKRSAENVSSLGILAHRTSDNEQGVCNHLRNERYLGSMKPFSGSVSQDPWGLLFEDFLGIGLQPMCFFRLRTPMCDPSFFIGGAIITMWLHRGWDEFFTGHPITEKPTRANKKNGMFLNYVAKLKDSPKKKNFESQKILQISSEEFSQFFHSAWPVIIVIHIDFVFVDPFEHVPMWWKKSPCTQYC